MNNKILYYIVVLLVPIAVISFFKFKKTNFYLPQKQEIEIILVDSDNKQQINLTDYTIGVLAGEMPASFEEEALKAQSVAIQTYTMYQMNHRGYVTKDDQAYLTKEQMQDKWQEQYEKYYQKLSKVVYATKNIMMYSDNEIIKSYYFAISSGNTESAKTVFNEDLDYLQSVSSDVDMLITKYLSTVEISIEDFKNKLAINSLDNIDIKYDDANYVSTITIDNKTYTGIEFRKILNLKSASFTITVLDTKILVECSGYGHGVGMSQYGANEYAKQGKTYKEILKHYYQNIDIKKYHV